MTTAVKERPILFSGPMVQAILEGRKTQTRRMQGLDHINGQPSIWNLDQDSPYTNEAGTHTYADFYCGTDEADFMDLKCPYGKPGDRLWIRETIKRKKYGGLWDVNVGRAEYRVDYLAGGTSNYFLVHNEEVNKFKEKTVPAIHMKRYESRSLLEITGVRIERLQGISQEDAFAEGVYAAPHRPANCGMKYHANMSNSTDCGICSFKMLWQSINGGKSWVDNPWVWVVEFKPVKN